MTTSIHGSGSAVAKPARTPWFPPGQRPGLDAALDEAFGPLQVRSLVHHVTDERRNQLLDELNSYVYRLESGEYDWDSAAWVTHMRKQDVYAGEETVCGEPTEFFLIDGSVLVWSLDVPAWELAVDTIATFAAAESFTGRPWRVSPR